MILNPTYYQVLKKIVKLSKYQKNTKISLIILISNFVFDFIIIFIFLIFRVLTDHLSGRRIVDVDYIFKQIQNSSHGGGLDCSFLNMSFVSEKRYGFFSKFNFQCKVCNIVKVISSEPSDKSYLPINKAVTNGTVAIGKLK